MVGWSPRLLALAWAWEYSPTRTHWLSSSMKSPRTSSVSSLSTSGSICPLSLLSLDVSAPFSVSVPAAPFLGSAVSALPSKPNCIVTEAPFCPRRFLEALQSRKGFPISNHSWKDSSEAPTGFWEPLPLCPGADAASSDPAVFTASLREGSVQPCSGRHGSFSSMMASASRFCRWKASKNAPLCRARQSRSNQPALLLLNDSPTLMKRCIQSSTCRKCSPSAAPGALSSCCTQRAPASHSPSRPSRRPLSRTTCSTSYRAPVSMSSSSSRKAKLSSPVPFSGASPSPPPSSPSPPRPPSSASASLCHASFFAISTSSATRASSSCCMCHCCIIQWLRRMSKTTSSTFDRQGRKISEGRSLQSSVREELRSLR
mmetsp:Transcript_36959/g.104307  ORF Transcript_36959/g.104307 Transcript_36959/m.104307 type:complete len:372 (+) Transcript_36959:1420-2535(+)